MKGFPEGKEEGGKYYITCSPQTKHIWGTSLEKPNWIISLHFQGKVRFFENVGIKFQKFKTKKAKIRQKVNTHDMLICF